MISFDEAYARILAEARPLGREQVPLSKGHRRILASPVIAEVDSPPSDVSAMDGYAMRESDLPSARVVGESFPGAGFSRAIQPHECVRIFTGAPVPRGADRVVVQEIVSRKADRITVDGEYTDARHIRPQGSDFRRGEALLPTGRMVDARALVAAAAADLARLEVWRQPRVSVLGTGDELMEPGGARHSSGGIPESVSLGVAALAEEWGGDTVGRERLKDDRIEIRSAAQAELERSDLLVVTGGASVGEKDYAKDVLAELGLELIFSKVAIKPGKPVWFGRAQGKLVLGLPGNPTSALVTARLIMAPLVRGLAGGDPADAGLWAEAPLASPLGRCGDRETFVRGNWSGDAVSPLENQDSGAQRSLAEAQVLIRRRPGAAESIAGETVEVISF